MEKKLHVFYREECDAAMIGEFIDSVDHLNEWVEVQLAAETNLAASNALSIHKNGIHIHPDWLDTRPALVFPSDIPFNRQCLLGVIFGMLRNVEQCRQHLGAMPELLYVFELMEAIGTGKKVDAVLAKMHGRRSFNSRFLNFVFNHNVAVALNYGALTAEIDPGTVQAHYTDALQLAFEPSFQAYTVKYYATFLMENGDPRSGLALIDGQDLSELSDYPRFSLQWVWCQCAMAVLTAAFEEALNEKLKRRLWQTLQFFERHRHGTIAAFLWMDAATVANLNASYTEALEYVDRAAGYFKNARQQAMMAKAHLLRAHILHSRARHANPQFCQA